MPNVRLFFFSSKVCEHNWGFTVKPVAWGMDGGQGQVVFTKGEMGRSSLDVFEQVDLFLPRCEEEAEELPRKATLPSMPPSPREEYAFSSGETTLRCECNVYFCHKP